MVRPNQIISSNIEQGKLTFIMFARNEETVKRRVLFFNFPKTVRDVVFGDETVDEHIAETRLVSSGRVNRYAVTVDVSEV